MLLGSVLGSCVALGRSIWAVPEQRRFLIKGLHCSIKKVKNVWRKSLVEKKKIFLSVVRYYPHTRCTLS